MATVTTDTTAVEAAFDTIFSHLRPWLTERDAAYKAMRQAEDGAGNYSDARDRYELLHDRYIRALRLAHDLEDLMTDGSVSHD